MRRQKRDISHRAYIKGYQAGFNGRTRESCPHAENTISQINWLNGWREGREDKRLGYNEQTGQQKVANL
ncbi:MAG: ribosome modulation factor [bacterium]